MKYPIRHVISLSVLLFGLWLALSGHLTPLLLSLGVASTALTVYIAHRMDVIDHETFPAHMRLLMFRYWFFLSKEIIASNIDVIRRVFRPGKNISPQLIELPVTMETDLSRVIYANSITLTPGTVSVNLKKDSVTVHALSKEGADDLRSGRMASAVPPDYVEPTS